MSAQHYAFVVEGLSSLAGIEDIPADIERAAVRAINKTVPWTRTRSAREIRRQTAFPARYLSGEDGRLEITERARAGSLEGRITARQRATSLARFVTGRTRRRGIRVTVKPGSARYIRRGFLIPLRGAGGDLNNTGLAIRTDGSAPKGAYKPKRLFDNVWLVYGPSVDQVFRQVREDVSEDAADYLEVEFNRLLDLEGV